MKWSIVSDSSCDLLELDGLTPEVSYSTVPLSIRIGDTQYIDDESLDVSELVSKMSASKEKCESSCPSPGMWLDKFMMADQTIALTISSELSGSYASALAARDIALETAPEKKIHVIDSRATGPSMILIIRKVLQFIGESKSFDTVVSEAEAFKEKTELLFVLSAFNNLINSGRLSPTLGLIASKLRIILLGCAHEGNLRILKKERRLRSVIDNIVEEMKKRGFKGGSVIINHCFNAEAAAELYGRIMGVWSSAKITILPTRGLDSFYAQNAGFIIAF